MPKKTARPQPKPKRQPTFIRAWRKHRDLKGWQLAERIGLSESQISRLERGESPYSQDLLELIATELNCSVADLLMRDPTQPESIWTIWDQLEPVERQRAIGYIEGLKKAG